MSTRPQQRLAFSAHPTGTPLRLLHISDIHYEGMSPRESALLAHVEALKPDLIVLTGDYLNLSSVHDPEAQAGVRALLSQLHAPGGVYAITGSPAVDVTDVVPHIFEGLPIRWLNDEITPVSWHGLNFWLMGVRCTLHPERDSAMLKQLKASIPSAAPILLLYHTPDLMPDAAHLDIDLYLAGHTHGGQLRLPLYGAIFTSSRWGKRYEMGRLPGTRHHALRESRAGVGRIGRTAGAFPCPSRDHSVGTARRWKQGSVIRFPKRVVLETDIIVHAVQIYKI
jgi:predicted MPP superfamily phosphohydrolase